MKVFVAFLLCVVAVFGEGPEVSEHEKKMNNILVESSNACIRELNKDPSLINDKAPATDPSAYDDPCFHACMHKKMGVMKEDGTYSLERLLVLADTPKAQEKATEIYNTKIKDCVSTGGNDHCKIAGCIQKKTRSYYVNH